MLKNWWCERHSARHHGMWKWIKKYVRFTTFQNWHVRKQEIMELVDGRRMFALLFFCWIMGAHRRRHANIHTGTHRRHTYRKHNSGYLYLQLKYCLAYKKRICPHILSRQTLAVLILFLVVLIISIWCTLQFTFSIQT